MIATLGEQLSGLQAGVKRRTRSMECLSPPAVAVVPPTDLSSWREPFGHRCPRLRCQAVCRCREDTSAGGFSKRTLGVSASRRACRGAVDRSHGRSRCALIHTSRCASRVVGGRWQNLTVSSSHSHLPVSRHRRRRAARSAATEPVSLRLHRLQHLCP